MRPVLLVAFALALACAPAACSSSSNHPAPIGDCPPGDHCNVPTGGGQYTLPESGADGADGGAIGLGDAAAGDAPATIDATRD